MGVAWEMQWGPSALGTLEGGGEQGQRFLSQLLLAEVLGMVWAFSGGSHSWLSDFLFLLNCSLQFFGRLCPLVRAVFLIHLCARAAALGPAGLPTGVWFQTRVVKEALGQFCLVLEDLSYSSIRFIWRIRRMEKTSNLYMWTWWVLPWKMGSAAAILMVNDIWGSPFLSVVIILSHNRKGFLLYYYYYHFIETFLKIVVYVFLKFLNAPL